MPKRWLAPQLVELVRGSTEEAVLAVCKGDTGTYPNNTHPGCWHTPDTGVCWQEAPTGHVDSGVICSECQAIQIS
jgi:hypothetical protein